MMKKGTEIDSGNAREDVLSELFQHAEPRERAPLDKEREIRDALHDQWNAAYRRRVLKRRGLLAMAASVAVAAVVAIFLAGRSQPLELGATVAEVVLTKGHSSYNRANGEPGTRLSASMVLSAGQEIRTAPGGGLTLRWQNGITLRFDQDSSARLLSAKRVALLLGRVYVDTNTATGQAETLVFDTPAGPIRHEGTLYMLGVRSGDTYLSVRDGRVLLGADGANGGERLVVMASGEQSRETIEPFGEQWAWTEQLAVPIDTDGRSVSELLDWVAQETGRTVEYASGDARQLANGTLVHGDLGDKPLEVLELAMKTTDLEAVIHDGTIRVATEPAD